MIVKNWNLLIFLSLSIIGIARADTEITGGAITSSFTMTGPVSISTLTAKSISVSTITVVRLRASDGSTSLPSITFSNDLDTGFTRSATNTIDIVTAGVLAARWTSAGEVTQPLQPSFLTHVSPTTLTNVTGDGTIYQVAFNTEIYDWNNDISGSTFTAPVSGIYKFSSYLYLDQLTASHTDGVMNLITSNRTYPIEEMNFGAVRDSTSRLRIGGSVYADMDANDTARIQITISNGTLVVDLRANSDNSTMQTSFSGSLIN